MTDDLVQRLRRTYHKEYAPTGSMCGDISNRLRPFPILATEVPVNPDGHEAADRIEALQADNAKLREVLQGVTPPAYFGESEESKAWWTKARTTLQETGQ